MTTTGNPVISVADAPVATITMNRPDNLNAFTTRMLAEIRHALEQAERDTVRSAVRRIPLRRQRTSPLGTGAEQSRDRTSRL